MITQKRLDEIFEALRNVHASHWKAPRLADVEKEIERVGEYVFRIGSNPWVAEIRITAESVDYVVNDELPERMRQQTEKMKDSFTALL